MIWISVISLWVLALAMLCLFLSCRVYNLRNDLDWWREEAIKLNKKFAERK